MRAKWCFGARCVYIFGKKKLALKSLKAHISCMTGCTETAVIVNFFLFDPVFKFYLQWLIFLHSVGRCLLITSSCSLMSSACGPRSKATSITLMWGQETTIAIKSWAEIRYRTYGRHFRDENGRRMARINEGCGSAVSSRSKTLEGQTSLDQWWCFQGLWGHMWPWSQTHPMDEDAALAGGLFHHSEPGSAFPCGLFF